MKSFSPRLSRIVQPRMRARAWKVGRGIVFGVLALAAVSVAQEKASRLLPKVRGVSRAPYSHIYMHFLLYQNHLDKAAAERELEGKDGAWLRNSLQKRLGFSSSQFALVRASALRLDSKLKANTAQAQTILQTDRAARLSSLATPQAVSSPSAEIKNLSKQREDTILAEESDLDRKLGPVAATKLQTFLKNEFLRSTRNQPPFKLPAEPHLKAVQP